MPMMLPIRLGTDIATGRGLFVPEESLSTHLSLTGATGTGKTTAIHRLLRPIMAEPAEQCCLFVFDPMGNLSFDLLKWIASDDCPEHVRRRLSIEQVREDGTLRSKRSAHPPADKHRQGRLLTTSVIISGRDT